MKTKANEKNLLSNLKQMYYYVSEILWCRQTDRDPVTSL